MAFVQFGISYTGSTQYKDGWDISVVNVELEETEANIFVELAKSQKQEVTQYPKFQIIQKMGNALPNVFNEQQVDSIHVSSAIAEAMQLSAGIFKLCKTGTYRDDLPVFLDQHPKFEAGKSYNIQIANKENRLVGTIIEISEQELQRQVQFARCYPHSMIYSPQKETQLSPDQDKIYNGVEGTVYAIEGWIDRFAEDTGLPSSEEVSYYEAVAKEVLRQLVKQIKKEPFEHLLKLHNEGNDCQDPSRQTSLAIEYQKAQLEALGVEGYATVMRKTLEAFAGNSASQHKEKIEKLSQEFANCYNY